MPNTYFPKIGFNVLGMYLSDSFIFVFPRVTTKYGSACRIKNMFKLSHLKEENTFFIRYNRSNLGSSAFTYLCFLLSLLLNNKNNNNNNNNNNK